MPRLALAFAYDGVAFESYARQPGHRTVEGELVRLLEVGGAFPDARRAGFRSASRTDAGVSAVFNVAAFDTETPARAVASMGTRAPPGLHVLGACEVRPGFDPRKAVSRTYRYFLERPWPWRRLAPVAAAFEGEHDFTNFRRADKGKPPRARIETIAYRARERCLEVRAPFFLWQQVRRIVAALDGVASGRWTTADVRAALDRPERRADLGVAAPEGLVLWDVRYPDLDLQAPPRAVLARLASDVDERRRGLRWVEAVAARGGPNPARR